jgi:hypothetical protein
MKEVAIAGLVVSVLLIGSKVRGFKLAEDYGFLKAIKIHISTSFAEEVKPLVPSRKILWDVKNTYRYEEIHRQNSRPFLSKFLLLPYLMSASNCQRALVDESGMIRNEMGTDCSAWDTLCETIL